MKCEPRTATPGDDVCQHAAPRGRMSMIRKTAWAVVLVGALGTPMFSACGSAVSQDVCQAQCDCQACTEGEFIACAQRAQTEDDTIAYSECAAEYDDLTSCVVD